VIQPGQFDEFEVSVGPLPDDADQILFPTLQTYQGGEVVRWIDEPLPSGEEPEHPAPALTLVDADGEHGGSGDEGEATADGEQAANSARVTVENAATQDDVDSANLLGIIGIGSARSGSWSAASLCSGAGARNRVGFCEFSACGGNNGDGPAVASRKAVERRPCSSPCQGLAPTAVTVGLPLRRWRRPRPKLAVPRLTFSEPV
jgi:Domain of unkown function (DUF1775)